MSKYKLEDLKVGAVFKNGDVTKTIIAVGKKDVFYSHHSLFGTSEGICRIGEFLSGGGGELVVPDVKTNKIKTKKGTLAWAMVQLAKGLKVRRQGGDAGGYIQLTGELNAQRLVTGRGGQALIGWSHRVDEWELCEEKEEKIK